MKRNWREYLIELVIVIIGITVAFWLNNMAEDSKENKLEAKFINDIQSDLIRDSTNLNTSYQFSQHKTEKVEGILQLLIQDAEMNYQDSLFQSIGVIGNYNFFFPESFTINSLLQSGDFKTLKSDQLKKELLRLRWLYEMIERDQNNFTKALDENYYPKVLTEIDMITGKVENPSFFYGTQFRNWVVYVYNDTSNLSAQYNRSKKQIRKILGIIEEIQKN
ncbi:DUF6090 family protein [Ekhidna sp.]|uniref:DUF6090 family protein n=1 Tax=Ekhidna sp. TaxID=2608089 RepID=UPI00329A3F9F